MSETICLKGDVLEVEIKVLILQNDNLWFYVSPSLNLDAYGNTEDEARNAFNELIISHFKFQVDNNLLDKDLRRLGWLKKDISKNKLCTPPVYRLFPDFSTPKNGRAFNEKHSITVH